MTGLLLKSSLFNIQNDLINVFFKRRDQFHRKVELVFYDYVRILLTKLNLLLQSTYILLHTASV